MCPHGRAHWRHLANTIELVLPSAHPSPQSKRQIDRFSRFCTAQGRKSLHFTMGDPFLQNCPFSWWIWTLSNSWFLRPIWADKPNGISVGSAVFAQMTADGAECHYTLQWDAPFPLKIAPSRGEFGPNLIHGSLGPQVLNPNGISIGPAV